MINILWNSFEIVINYYQAFVQVYFIYMFLKSSKKSGSRALSFAFGVILGTSLTFLNSITIFEGIYSFIYIAIVFLYATLTFKGGIIKKLFISISSFSIVLIITIVELNFFAAVFEMSVENMITDRSWKRLICLSVIQISIYFALCIALTSFKYADKYAFSDWLPIITLLIATCIFASLLHVLSLSIDPMQIVYVHIAYVVLLILNFLMFYIIHLLYRKNKRISEMKLIELKEQYFEQYIDNANLQYESIRKIRHDIKDKVSTVYSLLVKGNYNEAISFIEKSSDVIERIETFVQTNNVVANAIINSKLTTASTLGIRVSCITVADINGIDETDLCDLLSNMLENAIAACQDINDNSKRFINLNISNEDNIYTFFVKNSIQMSVLKTNPYLKTTKSDKTRHGLGTAIIKDIAYKYNGRSDFYEQNNTFCCSVVLKTEM